jgi:hypothetical protein
VPPQTLENEPPRVVTPRAVLLGLALIPLNAYWVILAELRWYLILTLNPLFVTPVFFLLVLLGVNVLLRWLRPRWAFTVAELATVYIMLAISCTVATHDFVINLMSIMGWNAWYATPENRWETLLFPHLPRWLLVWNRDALRGYFEGGSSPYVASNIAPWIAPLLVWIAFMLVLFAVMFCLNVMVRKAWIEDTKLSFPIVRLPLAMVGLEATGFFRSRAMWVGAVLPAISGTLNGLAQLYPGIPHFQTRAHWHFFTNPPWNVVSGTPTSYYPFAIGLGYLVPLDVLFSCWFFYVFIKAQQIVGYYVGLGRVSGYPFVTEQGIGAWVTYGVLILYVTRHRWRRLFIDVWSRKPLDDERELLPYRSAFVGAVGGLILLTAFWRAVGMTLLPAVIAVLLYFLLALSITRVRAEAGSQHTVWDLEPMRVFGLVDTRHLGEGNIVGAGLSHWFWRLNRSHAMPTQLEGLKIWNAAGLTPRRLALPMIVATIAACIAGPWACLHVGYREGMEAKSIGFARWTGYEMQGWLSAIIVGGQRLQWPRLAAVGGASALTLALWLLQARYPWLWPHPLGYCAGPGLIWLWFPFLIAWLVKYAIVRYGGQKTYRNLMPFFLGLVLGDYVTGAVWAIISPILNVQGYQIFH